MPLAGVYGAVEPALVREDLERLERQESERRETLLQSGKARGPCFRRQGALLCAALAAHCAAARLAAPVLTLRLQLKLARFSRSTSHAVRFCQELQQRRASKGKEAATTAAANASPPAQRRAWHDMKADKDGLFDMVREQAFLLIAIALFSLLGILASHLHWGPVATFGFSFVALLPLAMLLGDLTEGLAEWCGPVLGGLLNATLGNATEAIVLVQAVRHGLVGVEQAALLGGVLSNMLLVVGLSFTVSKAQAFDKRVAHGLGAWHENEAG